MVGKIEIIFTPHVIDFLDNLVRVLYKKEYFGFIETAEKYVFKIYDEVPQKINLGNFKLTPKSLKYLGANYIFTNPIKERLCISSLKNATIVF